MLIVSISSTSCNCQSSTSSKNLFSSNLSISSSLSVFITKTKFFILSFEFLTIFGLFLEFDILCTNSCCFSFRLILKLRTIFFIFSGLKFYLSFLISFFILFSRNNGLPTSIIFQSFSYFSICFGFLILRMRSCNTSISIIMTTPSIRQRTVFVLITTNTPLHTENAIVVKFIRIRSIIVFPHFEFSSSLGYSKASLFNLYATKASNIAATLSIFSS